jgi:hypothetical protein
MTFAPPPPPLKPPELAEVRLEPELDRQLLRTPVPLDLNAPEDFWELRYVFRDALVFFEALV